MRITQISESKQLGILLALSGGFMDAYSYIQRGHVFANAQTGNMLLFGINLSQLKFLDALQYAIPVVAFTLGIALAEQLRACQWKKLHWRQIALIIETTILISVAFFNSDLNLIANSLTSFACGIQVETFRKIQGLSAATTMCIGNLRSGTENLFKYLHTKERHYFDKGAFYYLIIFCFIMGAVIGNFFIHFMHRYAIIICSWFLIAAFLMMFIDLEKEMNAKRKH